MNPLSTAATVSTLPWPVANAEHIAPESLAAEDRKTAKLQSSDDMGQSQAWGHGAGIHGQATAPQSTRRATASQGDTPTSNINVSVQHPQAHVHQCITVSFTHDTAAAVDVAR